MGLTTVTLDTNTYTALLKGDKKILELIKNANQVILPAFVIAELLFGFKKGTRKKQNLKVLADFESYPKVRRHYPGPETLEIFSDLLLQLKQTRTPIPTHDVWIAAIAIENGSTLLTYDKHFQHIVGLRLL